LESLLNFEAIEVNPDFQSAKNVLEEHKQRLADWQSKLAHVKAALAALQS
jgi:hypothetical protein